MLNDNPAWSEICAQLSEFFKEPSTGFAEDVATGRLARFFEDRLRWMGLDAALSQGLVVAEGNVRTQLNEEYRRLFLGPTLPYIVPVESVYKKWANDPDCQLPIAQEKGYLMGDPAIDMMRRYRAEGIESPAALSSMPDHIALLLEYLSRLFLDGDKTARQAFIAQHLDWLDDLVRDIEAIGTKGIYATGAKITCIIMTHSTFADMSPRAFHYP